MKRFELKLKEGLKSSVYTIALVAEPAIMEDFIYLSKNSIKKTSFSDTIKFKEDEQGIIYTPVLIPNLNIPRTNEDGEPYEVYFSEETVRQAARDFIAAGTLVSEFDSEHDEYERLDGVTVVESWVIDDPNNDKANTLGFNLPKGTWMQAIKVDNEEVRAKIKDGTYKGVSVEMKVDYNQVEFSKQSINNNKNSVMSEFNKAAEFLSTVSNLFSKGEDAEGKAPLTDEQKLAMLEDGEYTLMKDGREMKVRVSGGQAEVVEIEEEMEKKEEMSEESASVNQQMLEGMNKVVEVVKDLKMKVDSNTEKLSQLDKAPAVDAKLSAVDTEELTNLKKFNLV